MEETLEEKIGRVEVSLWKEFDRVKPIAYEADLHIKVRQFPTGNTPHVRGTLDVRIYFEKTSS